MAGRPDCLAMSFKWIYLFQRLDRIEKRIIVNNTELTAALQAATAKIDAQAAIVAKIGTETAGLLAAVDSLQTALDGAGGTSAEVDAALAALATASDSLSAALTAVDAQVPDAAV